MLIAMNCICCQKRSNGIGIALAGYDLHFEHELISKFLPFLDGAFGICLSIIILFCWNIDQVTIFID